MAPSARWRRWRRPRRSGWRGGTSSVCTAPATVCRQPSTRPAGVTATAMRPDARSRSAVDPPSATNRAASRHRLGGDRIGHLPQPGGTRLTRWLSSPHRSLIVAAGLPAAGRPPGGRGHQRAARRSPGSPQPEPLACVACTAPPVWAGQGRPPPLLQPVLPSAGLPRSPAGRSEPGAHRQAVTRLGVSAA